MHGLQAIAVTFFQDITDAFAPPRCVNCLQEDNWYCTECRRKAPIAVQSCIICKAERPRGTTCIDCREETSITGIISVGIYADHALQRGIEWLKFKGIRGIAPMLAGLIMPRLSLIAPITELSQRAILVPIPLHKRKYRDRGFNQSEDIAQAIETICNIEVANLLTRTKSTTSQARLPHDMRKQNISGAFQLACSEQEFNNRISEKNIIILLDDVSTTGSTLSEAASAFEKLEDTQIWAVTVARG
jgi:competence protein ComFC